MRLALPLFLAAETPSLFGNSAISIVLPWLVLSRTGEPSTAGMIAAVPAEPAVLAALVGGWLIDRVGRRQISVLADLGSAAAVAALVLVDQSVGLTVSSFIVLGVVGALFDVPCSPVALRWRPWPASPRLPAGRSWRGSIRSHGPRWHW